MQLYFYINSVFYFLYDYMICVVLFHIVMDLFICIVNSIAKYT